MVLLDQVIQVIHLDLLAQKILHFQVAQQDRADPVGQMNQLLQHFQENLNYQFHPLHRPNLVDLYFQEPQIVLDFPDCH